MGRLASSLDLSHRIALVLEQAGVGGEKQVALRYLRMGEALPRAKILHKALRSMRRSIEKDSTSARARARLGRILAAPDDGVKALPAFRRAIELDPGSAEAKQGLADCAPK